MVGARLLKSSILFALAAPCALACADRVVRPDREAALAHFELGTSALTANQLSEAVEHLQAAVTTDATFAVPHRALGITYARLGQGDAAVEHYRRYLSLFPDAPDGAAVTQIIADYERED